MAWTRPDTAERNRRPRPDNAARNQTQQMRELVSLVNRGNTNARKRPYEWYLSSLRNQARPRNLDVTVTYDEMLSLVAQQACHYCGAAVRWYEHLLRGVPSRANLDRKDNSRGYSRDNLVVCCWRCNRGKGHDFSYAEWYAMTAVLRERP